MHVKLAITRVITRNVGVKCYNNNIKASAAGGAAKGAEMSSDTHLIN